MNFKIKLEISPQSKKRKSYCYLSKFPTNIFLDIFPFWSNFYCHLKFLTWSKIQLYCFCWESNFYLLRLWKLVFLKEKLIEDLQENSLLWNRIFFLDNQRMSILCLFNSKKRAIQRKMRWAKIEYFLILKNSSFDCFLILDLRKFSKSFLYQLSKEFSLWIENYFGSREFLNSQHLNEIKSFWTLRNFLIYNW